jgi:hypothetical protein
MTKFKHNFRLLKYNCCLNIIPTYNILNFICEKMSRTWLLWGFVSLKHCVAFFMKVYMNFFHIFAKWVYSAKWVLAKRYISCAKHLARSPTNISAYSELNIFHLKHKKQFWLLQKSLPFHWQGTAPYFDAIWRWWFRFKN